MELINGIKERRSIRRYSDKPVEREHLKNILDAVRYAPSWKNTQTSRYHIVVDKDLKTRIAEEAMCGFEKNKNNINSAPVLVVLSTVDNLSGYNPDGTPATPKGSHWQSFDAGIAAEAFCLAAYSEGLGTLIMGIFDEAKVSELIELPEGESISALIAVGYPEKPAQAPKRKSASEIAEFI